MTKHRKHGSCCMFSSVRRTNAWLFWDFSWILIGCYIKIPILIGFGTFFN